VAERPSLPEGLDEALKGIRPGFYLKWNPSAVLIKGSSYIDALGRITEPAYEPRWEVWDVDAYNNDYKVMTVRTPDGGYRQPGFWLVELLNYLNPARFGGDLSKMLRAVIDDPNNVTVEVSEADLDDLIDQAAKWHWYASTPKVSFAGLTPM
jgi:hypothetical protein